jgi:WD40 repeat protein/tRNA A-37 threonylcarbamoyl transferase component Bud32
VFFAPRRGDPDRYQILAEHGRGGLGRVYRARDKELGRHVALKELLQPSYTAEVRFFREAFITARLEHPAIVPVHEAGRWPDGTPYYAMKLVSGRPLAKLIAEAKELDERLALIPHLIAVADAIAYAHDRKIIHRDLKPSNVIVGDFGETIVIDWGLAKELAVAEDEVAADPYRVPGASTVTVAGSVLGTPAYMSPEQSRGEAVDTRTDVYSLGAMLLQLCTGDVPPAEIGEADLRNALRPIPQDLKTIALKALSSNPGDRYADAGAFAADLRAFDNGARIAAREYSLPAMLGHWIRHHKRLATSVAVPTILVSVLGALALREIVFRGERATAAQHLAETARASAESERDRAARALEAARAKAGELLLEQSRSLVGRDPRAALKLLEQYDGAKTDQASAIAANAVAMGVPLSEHLAHDGQIGSLTYLRGGAIITSASDGTIRIWDQARKRDLQLMTGVDEVSSPSADGVYLAFTRGASVGLLNITSGDHRLLGEHGAKTTRVAMSASGHIVGSGSADGEIRVWNAEGRSPVKLKARGAPIEWLDVSPDGRYVAATSYQGGAEIWDILAAVRIGHWSAAEASRISFSAKGSFVAWSAANGKVSLFDLPQRSLKELPSDAWRAGPFVFSPSESYLLAGTSSGEVRVWDMPRGALIYQHKLEGQPYALGFASDSTQLAYADNKTLYVLQLESHERQAFQGLAGTWNLAFSPDSRVVATAGAQGSIRLWRTTQGVRILGKHRSFGTRLAFSHDGLLACGSQDGTVLLWVVATGSERTLEGGADRIMDVAFSPDGRYLVGASRDGTVHVWDVHSSDHRRITGHKGAVNDIAFSEDGRLLASASDDGSVNVREFPTGRSLAVWQHPSAIWAIGFTRDGHVLSFDADGELWSWKWPDGMAERKGIHEHPSAIDEIEISAAGDVATSESARGAVLLWPAAASTPRKLIGHGKGRVALAFSNDGILVAAGGDGIITIAKHLAEENGIYDIYPFTRVRFSPNGNLVAAATRNGSVDVWEPDTGRRSVFQAWDSPQDLQFSPSGAQVAVALGDGSVLLFSSLMDRATPEPTQLRSWIKIQLEGSD